MTHEDDERAEPACAAYDPNRGIWPTYRPGTRLPSTQVARWKDTLGLLVMLALVAGGGLLVWWFLATVRH